MLEVHEAKPLYIQRSKYNVYYFKNDEFYCCIADGHIDKITYLAKCDFETYMYTWKNQILARYLRACINYYCFMNPEFKHVTINDKMSVDCGRSIGCSDSVTGCAQFFYLSYFTLAFFKQPWFVRYMNATISEQYKDDALKVLDKPDPNITILIMKSSVWMDNCTSIIEKYEPICKKSKTVHEFFKTFTKRRNFKDCVPWVLEFIQREIGPMGNQYMIPASSTANTKNATIDSDNAEHNLEDFDNLNGSADSIIIHNQIIYTMCFSMADID